MAIILRPRAPIVSRALPVLVIRLFTPGTLPKSWKDICTCGKNKGEECMQGYIELMNDANGKEYIEITEDEIEENVKKWDNTLVGYVMGSKPFYSHIKACVARMWKPIGDMEVYSKENGYVFFKFALAEDCCTIL